MKNDYYVLTPRKKREVQSFPTRVAITLKATFSVDLFAGLKKALGVFFAPKVTIPYPIEVIPLSPRYRAIHKLQRLLESDNERCIGCGLCEKICTSNCIRIITDRGDDGRKKILSYSINFGRCIYCGLCAEVCPELAIVHSDMFENASVQRAHFGFKPTLLESKSSLIEFSGYGSLSPHADERMQPTPLSYVFTQDSQPSTESSTQENSNV
ncbi:NADH-quinone oxidoreductase subunit NuoI [Helicobacter mastomyrinus]|uniref:NADH-quinone oxidoreductase subunit I n=1 Tax=Helicobacter mastomyrinus TaxID=287948 RepID=A0ABZ3F6U3_9HELI|nr:NADH-quinone oxidoreductase subunit NuoI [uncultured Helicobacter sp.]